MSEIKGTFKRDISPAQAALRSIDGRLQNLGSRMLWVNNISKSAFTVINGAFRAITPVLQNVREAFDMGGKPSDLAAMTGQTASEVLVLRQAFANNGLAAADFEANIARLQRALSGVDEEGRNTSKALEALGIADGKLNGLTASGQLEGLRQAFSRIPDPVERTRLAMEIFGRSGTGQRRSRPDCGR